MQLCGRADNGRETSGVAGHFLRLPVHDAAVLTVDRDARHPPTIAGSIYGLYLWYLDDLEEQPELRENRRKLVIFNGLYDVMTAPQTM